MKRYLIQHIQEVEPNLSNLDKVAYDLVRPTLEELFGAESEAWTTERENGKTYIIIAPNALKKFLGSYQKRARLNSNTQE